MSRIRKSRTQAKNIAAENPEKLTELKELFWQEAERNRVLPLFGSVAVFFGILPPLPTRTRFPFAGDVQNVQKGLVPRVAGRSYAIEAELLHEFRRNGSQFPAYTSIVATGANACVLHYRADVAPVRKGELVLIDAGADAISSSKSMARSPGGHREGRRIRCAGLPCIRRQGRTARRSKRG